MSFTDTTAFSVTVQPLGNPTKGHKSPTIPEQCLNNQFVKSFVLLCTISKVHTMGKLNKNFLQLTINTNF